MTDIWRSFVAQSALWQYDYEVAFRKPIARQERNPHNLSNDFKEEFTGFIHNKDLIECLELNGVDLNASSQSLSDTALHYLSVMVKGGFLEKVENQISQLWHEMLRQRLFHKE
jgi:hypothetical protein